MRRTILAICLLLLALQLLALTSLGPQLWGVHFYAYLPLPIAIASWLVLATMAVLFLAPTKAPDLPSALIAFADRIHDSARWTLPLGMLLAGLLFWLLRSQQTFLGDTWTIMNELAKSEAVHPREPLTRSLQLTVYRWLAPAMANMESTTAIQRSVALTSVAAGMAFVGLSAWIARALTRDRVERVLVCLLLLAQGYAQLFFGYVEFYTLYAFGVGAFVLSALLALRGTMPLLLPGIVLVITCGLHFSAVLLVPAWLLLVAFRWRRGSAVPVARDVGLTVMVVLGLDLLLRSLEEGASVVNSVRSLWAKSELDSVGGSGFGYMFSIEHLRDFSNEQLLVGPWAALLLIVSLVTLLRSGRWKSAELALLFTAATVSLLAQWFMSEPDLGYARDWDLFAPLAVSMTVAGVAGLLRVVDSSHARRGMLLVMLIFSIGHTLPWVWNNASERRALARVETLPLGFGRAEFLVGNWYWRHGELDAAAIWFQRAIEKHPANHSAHYNLGSLRQEQGRSDEAVLSFQHAVNIRPHQTEFLLGLTRALVAAGRSEEALPHLERLRRKEPENFQFALYQGQVLRAIGREQEARRSFREGTASLSPPLRGYQENLDAGLLLTQAGRAEESIDYFREAFRADPNSGTAAYYLAATLWQAGREEQVQPILETALRLELSQPQRRQLRRWLRQLEGDD